MSDRHADGGNQFLRGFLAAFVTLGAFGIIFKALEWAASQPQPQAIVDWMSTPRFSVFNLIEIALFVVVIYLFLWMAAFGPRPGVR